VLVSIAVRFVAVAILRKSDGSRRNYDWVNQPMRLDVVGQVLKLGPLEETKTLGRRVYLVASDPHGCDLRLMDVWSAPERGLAAIALRVNTC
jgi:hypothetical protein